MSLESRKNWVFPERVEGDILKWLMDMRGFDESFLEPSLKDIPSFKKLKGTKEASKKILEYVKEGKKIVIHGDYDADGICASSILWEFLYRELSKHLDMKVDIVPYTPDRVEQGYGLTESSLNDVKELGADLIITVDCGVRDKELIKKFVKDTGIEIVVTDHHLPPDDILDDLDYILVHQMYPGYEYPDIEICGASISFLLTQAIRKELGMNESMRGMDLVALATVTDIMPLVGVNRVFVKYGLEEISKGERLGLNELIKVADINPKDIDSYHLGFVIGPRINATGRIGAPMDAIRLLVSSDEGQCKELAGRLDSLNYKRQKITFEAIDDALDMLGSDIPSVVCIKREGWHEGIVGLIAGKLQERLYRPTLVATQDGESIKGSARSIKGFNVTQALEECSEFLDRFGGHEQAGGFSLKESNWDMFVNRMQEIGDRLLTEDMLKQELRIDLYLDTNDINVGLVNKLDMLKPYGMGNPKPVIGLKNLVVVKKQVMGKQGNHMKLVCKGGGVDLLTMVMFNCIDDVEGIHEDSVLDVVGSIGINSWNGNDEVQFLVKEWRFNN